MGIRSSSDNKRSNWFLSIILFLFIFFSNDTMMFGTNLNGTYVKIGFLVEVLLIGVFWGYMTFYQNALMKISNQTVAVLVIWILCLMMSAVINSDFRGGYVTSLIMIIIGYLYSEYVSFHDFCLIFKRVGIFLAVCSVIGFILTTVFPAFKNMGISVYRESGMLMKNYIVYARAPYDATAAARAFSIFREPGVFQAYLNVALLIAVKYFDHTRKARELLGIFSLVIAIALTVSTTGFVVMILVFLFFILSHRKEVNGDILGIVILIGCIAIVGAMIYLEFFSSINIDRFINEKIMVKFDKGSDQYESGGARVASLVANAVLWTRNPLFGVGITAKQVQFNLVCKEIMNSIPNSDTNTIFAQLSMHGIGVGLIWILGMLGLVRKAGVNFCTKIIVFAIILTLMMTEYFCYSTICNIWLIYGIRLIIDKSFYTDADHLREVTI